MSRAPWITPAKVAKVHRALASGHRPGRAASIAGVSYDTVRKIRLGLVRGYQPKFPMAKRRKAA